MNTAKSIGFSEQSSDFYVLLFQNSCIKRLQAIKNCDSFNQNLKI